MISLTDSLNFLPPHANGSSTDRQSPANTTVTSSTTAATAVHPLGISGPYTLITWMTNQPVRIRVGPSTVAAATASDMLLPANVYISWAHNTSDTHFTAILDSTATGNATLQRWLSSP